VVSGLRCIGGERPWWLRTVIALVVYA
jgi:hypothetical protein